MFVFTHTLLHFTILFPHPSQDRALTISENARLQGFPGCYILTFRTCQGEVNEIKLDLLLKHSPAATSILLTLSLREHGALLRFPTCIAGTLFLRN